jgi:DNA-directed RNA polymerase subunit RPC12/RpoP
MPIHFRCVYCNQLLGTARRKAGTVVRCTSCEGQIIVPDAEPKMAAAARPTRREAAVAVGAGPTVFEQNDLEELLRPFQSTQPAKAAASSSSELRPLTETDSPRVRTAQPAAPRTPPLWAGAMALAAVAGGLGFWIGRMTAP